MHCIRYGRNPCIPEGKTGVYAEPVLVPLELHVAGTLGGTDEGQEFSSYGRTHVEVTDFSNHQFCHGNCGENYCYGK